MTRKLKYFLLGANLIIFIISIAIVLYLAIYKDYDWRRNLTIKDVSICSKLDSGYSEKEMKCSNAPKSSAEEVYVCGYIESSDVHIRDLTILLYEKGIEKPIYVNPGNDEFTTGYFCRKIGLPIYEQGKSYIVKIFYFRTIIATTEFEIQ